MDRNNRFDSNGNPPQVSLNPSGPPQIRRIKTLESIGPSPPSPSLNINRNAFNVTQFNQTFSPIPTSNEEKKEKFKPDLSGKAWTRRFQSLLPITLWLPEYNIRQNLLADILVGITIAIFQVPQSMGYCLIAQVPPVYGLYSSFFPALMYTFLGTGMHSAFGPFAIVSGVMTGDIVIQVMTELNKDPKDSRFDTLITGNPINNFADFSFSTIDSITTIESIDDQFPGLKNIDVAIMVAVIIGAYILVFGIFQLGFISNFMSEELISGFTTSACIIVFVSQLRYLLGADLGHFSGPFNMYYTIEDIVKKINDVNLTTLTISGICLATLLLFKLLINPLTLKLGIKTPFPIEILVVIGGTLASHFLNLKDEPYNVQIVGTIGNKFPGPKLPYYQLYSIMWSKCIPTAIVGYTITLSVAKIYGRKHGYKVDANQEMLAMGATNIFAAFFQCIPAAASLPRSALQETAGGKTQIVSLVNCCCIVAVILALGKYLEELPICVLGSCIAVALVSLLNKIGEFRRFWKVSKLDGLIWIITFVCVLALSVDYGIYIGLVCSLLLLIYKSQRPKTYVLGTIDKTEIYVPINKFGGVEEVKDIKIFQFCGPLNFSNIEFFYDELETKCGVNVVAIKKFMKSRKYERSINKMRADNKELPSKNEMIKISMNKELPKYLIIDCSIISYIDLSGITTLKKTIQIFEDIGIQTVLAGVHVHIESMFGKEGFFKDVSSDHLYKSVHDAVTCLLDENIDGDSITQIESPFHQYGENISSQISSNQKSFETFRYSSSNTLNGGINEDEFPQYLMGNIPRASLIHKSHSMQTFPPPPPPRAPTTHTSDPNTRNPSPIHSSVSTPPSTRAEFNSNQYKPSHLYPVRPSTSASPILPSSNTQIPPPPPPPPPSEHQISLSEQIQAIKEANRKEEEIIDTNHRASSKTKHNISEKLKSRSDMLEGLYEERQRSNLRRISEV